MNNPITPDFDWSSLYRKYDCACKRFDQNASSLFSFVPKPRNDRYLYYDLIDRIARERETNGFISIGTYEGVLYWKLYSQPAAHKNICSRISKDTYRQRAIQKTLEIMGKKLPKTVSEDIEEVEGLYQVMQEHREDLYGLTNSCALPARSTLLHLIYPSTVPIFDKQVLLAVGVTEEDANRKQHVLHDYIQFAWYIAKLPYIPKDRKEKPLRLVDMALWVIRGNQNRLNKSSQRISKTAGSRCTTC